MWGQTFSYFSPTRASALTARNTRDCSDCIDSRDIGYSALRIAFDKIDSLCVKEISK